MFQLACSPGAATSFSFPILLSYQQAADQPQPGIVPPNDVIGAYDTATELPPGCRLKHHLRGLGLDSSIGDRRMVGQRESGAVPFRGAEGRGGANCYVLGVEIPAGCMPVAMLGCWGH